MNERNIIRRLRKKIPTMTCNTSCHDCCGPIVFSKWEWSRVPHVKATSLHCPYWKNGCSIYEERPILCRIFGTTTEVKAMNCPHGYCPEKPMTPEELQKITGKYISLFMEI